MAGEIADADNIMTVDDEDDERNYVCFWSNIAISVGMYWISVLNVQPELDLRPLIRLGPNPELG